MNTGYVINNEQLAGVALDKIFMEIDYDRNPMQRDVLQECIKDLKSGDTLWVEAMEMLGQSIIALNKIIHSIIKKGVKICFIKEKINFSDQDTPINQNTLQFLNHMAVFEKRMAEKQLRRIAKDGCYRGRPSKRHRVSNQVLDAAIVDINRGKEKTEVAKEFNISRPAFDRWLRERKEELTKIVTL
ncbi:MAG: recombinase family protein [Lentisphaerae bacterium]|nr:recombinase family protein [Lentisphaerota bacterium]